MIRNFRSKTAESLFHGNKDRHAHKCPNELHRKTLRLFDQLNAATRIETLQVPPSNRLEKLSGNLNGFWSLRVNKQWQVIFRWEDNNAHDVDVIDYH